MTLHIHGAVLTSDGIASNNRGENMGNVSTLQKILRHDALYTTVSAEAIRFAIREHWSAQSLNVNRKIVEGESDWADPSFENFKDKAASKYIDDDLFGFMNPKKETDKRRGIFEFTRALSVRPWTGDTVFAVAGVNAQPTGNKNPVPHSAEIHTTRYQYLFSLTPSSASAPEHVTHALDAVRDLHRVAGNHSRFLYDFSPQAIIFRLSHDPAPRMIYCYEEDELGTVSIPMIKQALSSGDIDPKEVIVGGPALAHEQEALAVLGVTTFAGVKQAFEALKGRLASSTKAQ